MKLFESCRIGSLELKNRIIMAPISCNFNEEGFVTDRMVRFFEERARGGVGLITIGDGIVDTPVGNNVKDCLAIDDDKYIQPLKGLAKAVHAHGAKIILQLSHAGRRAGRVSASGFLDVTRGKIPVAPSAIPHPVTGQVVPKELTSEEIVGIIRDFGKAARRVIDAGFDGVGLQCAHMYLCGQFLSPWANQRTDAYGGNFERRIKFVLEVIARIRQETGTGYPLVVRMNGEEPAGGNSLGDIREIARRFQQEGVDAIHVSVGFGAATKDPNFIPSIAPMRLPSGCTVHLSENIKRAVSIPVIAVNKILGNIYDAENLIQKGKADLIALGRPLIADPNLPIKASRGQVKDIRPCIYCCQGCIKKVLEKNAPLACSINPEAGFESEKQVVLPAVEKRKVLVVGGGPAGMQAALTAAMRGHHVTLIEKDNRLGGQLNLASQPPGKQDIIPFISYLINQIEKSTVTVVKGRALTAEWLDAAKFDVVIIATGSTAAIPVIPGINSRRVITGREVLRGFDVNGFKVAIIGGGQVGCEVAEFLAERGKEITVIERLPTIANEMPHINRVSLELALERLKVCILTQTKVLSIDDESLTVDRMGKIENILADEIVIAVGAQPANDGIDDMLKNRVPDVFRVGDQVKAQGILEAIRDGYLVASRI